MSDDFGDLIEDVVTSLRAEFTQAQQERETKQLLSEYDRIVKENKITKDEDIALNELSERFPWNHKTTFSQYITDLLDFHRSKAAPKIKEKQTQNLRKRPAGLASETNEDESAAPPKKLSLEEAVSKAARELLKKKG